MRGRLVIYPAGSVSALLSMGTIGISGITSSSQVFTRSCFRIPGTNYIVVYVIGSKIF
jgi:hypothetical protein